MNEYQKKKICELRISGLGYKAIANEVGLSRDVVRNFCKTNKLNGYLANMNENIRKMALENVLCLNCQKPLKQNKRGKARKFCSEECRRKWWKENADKGQRNETAVYKLVCAFGYDVFRFDMDILREAYRYSKEMYKVSKQIR